MRLATKLTLVLSASFALIFLIAAWWVGEREEDFADAQAGLHGRLLGRVVASMVHETATERGEAEARELLREIDRTEPSIDLRWVSFDAEPGDWDHSEALTLALAERLARGEVVEHVGPAEGGMLYTLVPIVGGDGRVERVVEISESLAARNAHLKRLRLQLVALALGALFIAVLGAHSLGRALIGRPVARLVEAARRVGRGDLSTRLAQSSRDELGVLAGELNAMVEQLDEAQRARREATHQLQHAERLATVGQLASGVAHEIGTPLQVISMRAEILARRAGDVDAARECSALIREQVMQIRRIVDELLSFARRDTPKRAVHDLRDIAEHALELLRMVSTDRPIEMLGVWRRDVPAATLSAEVDPEQIRQVIFNLVLNGVQAMPKGGRITVDVAAERRAAPAGAPQPGAGLEAEASAEPVEAGDGAAADATTETSWVRLQVEDEGSGIPPEVLPKLFEPFFTTKRRGEGTGLGLAICHSIVQEHGGFIEVDSEADRGTTFRVYLPALEVGAREEGLVEHGVQG